jgi:hypothetical protein
MHVINTGPVHNYRVTTTAMFCYPLFIMYHLVKTDRVTEIMACIGPMTKCRINVPGKLQKDLILSRVADPH